MSLFVTELNPPTGGKDPGCGGLHPEEPQGQLPGLQAPEVTGPSLGFTDGSRDCFLDEISRHTARI